MPKGQYETKISKLIEHTNLDRDLAVLPKLLRDEKKEKMEIKAKEEEAKRLYEEKNATKIRKQEKKKAKKEAVKKIEREAYIKEVYPEPLFVRNIGFETD